MADFKIVDGIQQPLTADEQAFVDQQRIDAAADIAANGYKRDRREAYGSVEDQLDMIYWDQVNGTTTFQDHVAAVKTAHPKP